MQWYKNGTMAATGAAVNQIVGFAPGAVRIHNLRNGNSMFWTNDMTSGYGILSGTFPAATGVLSSPGCSMGSTKDQVANVLFNFEIAGASYAKAATAAGTAPTATTIPQNKWGLFGFEIGADGTIDLLDAADNATGYASEALALAAIPTASASHVLFMYVTVMCTEAAGFIGATTNFDATGVTANFYNATLKHLATSGGISPYSTLGYGFTLGTNTRINISGDTLYWEAFRD